MKVDILIAGQGIAGSALALELYKRNIKFTVIDKGHEQSSSRVAGGLYNPVTYKRMLPSWNSMELLDSMRSHFNYAEELLDDRFIFQKETIKLFSSEHDRDILKNREAEPKLSEFTDAVVHAELKDFETPFGYMKFHQTGYVDTRKYIESTRSFLKEKELLIESEIAAGDVKIEGDKVLYKDLVANRIVYCTGANEQSEFWSYLPFRPVKGELMVIELESDIDKIVVKDGFLLPLGNRKFIMGSTYTWNNLNSGNTEEGLIALKEKLTKMTALPFKILERKAGVRPASHDRRPFVGWHPVYGKVGVLNGLGSKGVLYAPFCAECLINSLERSDPIPPEIDVKRVKH